MKIWSVISNREEAITASVYTSAEDAQAERRALVEEDWTLWRPNHPMPESTDAAFDELCSCVGYVDSYHVEEHDVDLLAPTGPYHGAAVSEQLRFIRSVAGTHHPKGIKEHGEAVDFVESVFADMLAALKDAVADAEAYAQLAPERSRGSIRSRIDGYRAAIAKAEGRSNG